MATIRSLGVAVLLLLAGCNGAPLGGGNSTGANVTTTASEPVYPPGVSAWGLNSTRWLGNGDWEANNDSGFAAELWINSSVPSSPVGPQRVHVETRVAKNASEYTLVRNRTGGGRGVFSQHSWSNQTFALQRTIEATPLGDPSSRYRRYNEPPELPQNPVASNLLQFLTLANYTTSSVEGVGPSTRIRLTANESSGERARQGNITAYDGEVVVGGEGRIRSANVTYGVRLQSGQLASFDVTYRLRETGVQRVERPVWYDAGLREAPRVDLNATIIDDRYIKVTHEGGDTIAANRGVAVHSPNGRYSAATTLTNAYQPGDTIYLYSAKNRSRQSLGLSRAEPTIELNEITGQFEVSFVGVSPTRRRYVIATTAVDVPIENPTPAPVTDTLAANTTAAPTPADG
jgi:hypothetical protein